MADRSTVAIVGVGLIGGSIGLALKAKRQAGRVIGVGRDPAKLEEARSLGAIDEGTTDLPAAARSADVIAVCTPVSRISLDVREAAAAAPHALITDAGSTKARIIEAVEADEPARACFVGAHPLAGSERRGAAHARADLFDGRVCVLTPTPRTPTERLEAAERFWQALGCRTRRIDPKEHDRALALTSHLPHVVAAGLARLVAEDQLELAAGAFRDGTRVAAADAALWAAIFLENRDRLIEALDAFQAELEEFRGLIASEDEAGLRSWWEQGRRLRQRFDDSA